MIGRRLEEAMHAQGMSWAALARRARVSPRRLLRLRHPGADPRFDLVLRLAAALGLEVSKLAGDCERRRRRATRWRRGRRTGEAKA